MGVGEISKSVCIVRCSDGGTGTGFLVDFEGRLCVFTYNHLLDSPEHCAGTVCEFGFLTRTTETHRFHLDPNSVFFTNSEHLDYSIIALDRPDRRKIKPLEVDEKVQAKKNTNVTIFGHPNGEPLAVSSGVLMTISEDGIVAYASGIFGFSCDIFNNW